MSINNSLYPNTISQRNLLEHSRDEVQNLMNQKDKSNQNVLTKKSELSIPKNAVFGVKQKILQYLAQNPQDNPGIVLPSENIIKAMKPIAKPKKKNNLLQAILDLRNDEDKLKRIQDEAEEIGKNEEIKNSKDKRRETKLILNRTLLLPNKDETLANTEFDHKLSDLPNKKLKQQIYLFLNVPEFSRMVID